jgi:hypothetical protein
MHLRKRLTYANVVSTLALFIALGGATAFAASHLARNSVGAAQLRRNAVTGAKVRDGSLTGSDLDVTTLSKVPSAKTADSAGTAAFATTASTAARADGIAPPEDPHAVGKPGEPAFVDGWRNFGSGEGAAFYKDREGVVHLQGRVLRIAGNELGIFILPPGYAPSDQESFSVAADNLGVQIVVRPTGEVLATLLQNNTSVFLDGITWRAGH